MSDALESVSLFDVYRGAPLGPREKSLAIRLALETGGRSPEEIDRIVDAVRRELERELGGRART
jgi:phenylalanyl-tRNA synthetase beta subunit